MVIAKFHTSAGLRSLTSPPAVSAVYTSRALRGGFNPHLSGAPLPRLFVQLNISLCCSVKTSIHIRLHTVALRPFAKIYSVRSFARSLSLLRVRAIRAQNVRPAHLPSRQSRSSSVRGFHSTRAASRTGRRACDGKAASENLAGTRAEASQTRGRTDMGPGRTSRRPWPGRLRGHAAEARGHRATRIAWRMSRRTPRASTLRAPGLQRSFGLEARQRPWRESEKAAHRQALHA